MYRVLLTESARRSYEDAPAPLQRKLDRCFETLAADPRQHPNIRALKGQLKAYYRYRVGDHRVIYRIKDEERTVLVAAIAHRREAY